MCMLGSLVLMSGALAMNRNLAGFNTFGVFAASSGVQLAISETIRWVWYKGESCEGWLSRSVISRVLLRQTCAIVGWLCVMSAAGSLAIGYI
jgi:hypothetical protein